MDLRDILSPEKEIPRSTPPAAPVSPAQSPRKYVQRTQSGQIQKHGPGASPLSHNVMLQANIPAHVLSPMHQPVSSPLISPVPTSNTPQPSRHSSTPMDALADLASLQNHQPTKPTLLRGMNSYEGRKSPSYPTALGTALTTNPRASFDINMVDIPKQLARSDFSGTSLPMQEQERLGQLMTQIEETPSAYDTHVEIIKILHDGFIDHIYPSANPGSRRNPHTYDLLSDLRNAREQMEKLFAVGEALWSDWLQDESILARTAEERLSVIEKFRKAIIEEVGSARLWTAYGDWVQHCYSWAHDTSQDSSESGPDEDRLLGRELFTREMVDDVWEQAVEQTSHNLAESHLTWDKYLDIKVPNSQDKIDKAHVDLALSMFRKRLQVPHAHWDDTFQSFSSFVSANLEAHYEELMSETNRKASSAKNKMSLREGYESTLEQAQTAQDRDAEYYAFTQYIEWERTPEKRRKPDPQLVDAVFQRAELRFPSDVTLWEEHAAYLLERNGPSPALLALLERASKHCPWSGSLWSQCLLMADRAGQSFQEVEGIKHNATSTGLLEAAGINEVVKVHAAWCSYLRRRSSSPNGNEEDIDVAEMGIRTSIENVSNLAAKLGLGGTPDPSFQLHRIYIIFLTESARWDNARQEFDTLVSDYGHSWEFWMRFYHWEMLRWRRFAPANQEDEDGSMANVAPPHLATAVLKKALEQANLDFPEPIMQALVTHCEDYEDADELLQAHLRIHKLRKVIASRRQIEAEEAAQASAPEFAQTQEDDVVTSHGSKRKRGDESEEAAESNKKSRNGEVAHESIEQPSADLPKRDRENATVLVQNLPDHITDTRIRQYFSNCGIIKNLKVLREDDISAVIEFEDDEAARYATSRDGQDLDGAILSVELDSGSTLYLTNYKASADEKYIRTILEKYGEIISVRFPSLQVNKKRRFCYVQFKFPSEAQAATELDGQDIDGLELVCKISNPAVKKSRNNQEASNDGRTIFIGQLNFKITEDEVKEAFSKYGSIEAIRLPLNAENKNRNKGIAFITYDSADSAQSALEMTGSELKGRKLRVAIASNGTRQTSTTRTTTSPAPAANGKAESPALSTTSNMIEKSDLRERQIFLTNIPDTVNESRVKAAGEKYGTVLRVILKTNHQGAILEYSTISEAGEAALKLDGFEIDPGRATKVVTEAEMKEMRPEKKVDKLPGATAKRRGSKDVSKPVPIGFAPPIRRPGQPTSRRGGLGQRSAAVFSSNQKSNANTGTDKDKESGDGQKTNGTAAVEKKSNDDFRNLLNQKKDE